MKFLAALLPLAALAATESNADAELAPEREAFPVGFVGHNNLVARNNLLNPYGVNSLGVNSLVGNPYAAANSIYGINSGLYGTNAMLGRGIYGNAAFGYGANNVLGNNILAARGYGYF